LYNIFHPSDPIVNEINFSFNIKIVSNLKINNFQLRKAYRLEPLIIKHYSTKSPIEIQKSSDPSAKISYKELNEKRSAINLATNVDSKMSKNSSNFQENKFMSKNLMNLTIVLNLLILNQKRKRKIEN
jgi:hypothetical protein